MRTLPCRRRGRSTYAYARSTGRARCTQAAALPVFDIDGSLFLHAVRVRAAECTPCRRRAHDCSGVAAAARRRTAAVGAGRGTRTARAHGNMSCRMIWSRSGVRWGLGRPRIWNSIGRTGVADRLNGRPMDPSVRCYLL